MSFAAKVVITIVVCFVLFAVGAIGLVAYLWSRHSGELAEAARVQAEQGAVFGRDTDEAGCLEEATARYKRNRGFSGAMATSMFVQGCWNTSRRTEGFCDGVPSPFDILRAGRWSQERARKAGLTDPFGPQVFGQLQAYCTDGRRRKDATPVTPR
jgi:hypothetical protein